jgi:hypothetical protein
VPDKGRVSKQRDHPDPGLRPGATILLVLFGRIVIRRHGYSAESLMGGSLLAVSVFVRCHDGCCGEEEQTACEVGRAKCGPRREYSAEDGANGHGPECDEAVDTVDASEQTARNDILTVRNREDVPTAPAVPNDRERASDDRCRRVDRDSQERTTEHRWDREDHTIGGHVFGNPGERETSGSRTNSADRKDHAVSDGTKMQILSRDQNEQHEACGESQVDAAHSDR